jgi:hypothetical protein
LAEPINMAAKDVSHLVEKSVRDMHGGHSALVHVDPEPGGF